MREANARSSGRPEYMGKRMDDWLVNMGDWNISRRRYYGLPLPFYPCSCGHLTVVGSRAELAERALGALDGLEELRRPWIDDVQIRCSECGEAVRRDHRGRRRLARRRHRPVLHPRVGEPGVDRRRATPPAPPRASPPPTCPTTRLGAVVPGRLGLGDARADPAVVLLAAVHVGRAHRSGAVPQGARLREDARRDGPGDARLVGEHDRRRGRLRAHGRRRHALAVLRAAARPEPAVRLRARPGDPAQAAHALEQRLVPRPVRQHRRLPPASPTSTTAARARRSAARPVARRRARGAGRRGAPTPTSGTSPSTSLRAFEAFVDDLSNWYVRRSRRRFWDGDEAALRTLWTALVDGLRVVAPIMPFLTEHLWQVLVADVAGTRPASVFLAGWPDGAPPTTAARRDRGGAPGRRARPPGAPAAGLSPASPCAGWWSKARRRRRPPRRDRRRAAGEGGRARARGRRAAGPAEPPGARPAARRRARQAARRAGGRRVRGARRRAVPRRRARARPRRGARRAHRKEGWAVAGADGATVALDIALDDELALEGRVYDLIHPVNTMRKEQGSRSPTASACAAAADADLLEHPTWIARETLAVAVEVGAGDGWRSQRPDTSFLGR